MSDDSTVADLLAFVLAGKPEPVVQAALSMMPAEGRAALGTVTETVAALAHAADPVALPAGLRARVLETMRERLARRPKKALLVCDMIVDHLTPGRSLEVPRAREIVPAVARRLEEARAEGVPVVYVLDRHADDDPELDLWPTHAVEGTEGAEVWPPLAPKEGDRVVTKATYSGFTGSTLEAVLDELRVDTLVLTGCATEVQLLATAKDALERGFAVEVPPDAQAGNTPQGEAFAMGLVAALLPYAPARLARLARLARPA
jgi:nicotinamidase-related amidase